jgi:hypothetical protein
MGFFYLLVLVLFCMWLKKQVDHESKAKEQNARKHYFPARISKLSQDAAKVKTKRGRLASNGANVENATRQGWEVIHYKGSNKNYSNTHGDHIYPLAKWQKLPRNRKE